MQMNHETSRNAEQNNSVSRRRLLAMTGACVAALGAMTFAGATPAMAQDMSNGANNFYGYSNAEVDALFDELNGTSDPDRQKEILIEAESYLWEDAFGITLFQHPGLAAYNSNYVEGIDPIALSPTLFWNVYDWTIPS